MKANPRTHHSSKLIADVLVPEGSNYTYTNRRGHDMLDRQPLSATEPALTQHVHDHYCYEHGDEPREKLTLSTRMSALFAAIWSRMPRLTAKKYTVDEGLQTDWKAMLPSTKIIASSATLAAVMIVLNLITWVSPQRTTPIVKTDSTPVVTNVTDQRGVLSAQESSQSQSGTGEPATASDNSAVWWMPWVASTSSSAPRNNGSTTTTPVISTPSTPSTGTPLTPEPEVIVPPVTQPEPPAPVEPTPTEPDPVPDPPPIEEILDELLPQF